MCPVSQVQNYMDSWGNLSPKLPCQWSGGLSFQWISHRHRQRVSAIRPGKDQGGVSSKLPTSQAGTRMPKGILLPLPSRTTVSLHPLGTTAWDAQNKLRAHCQRQDSSPSPAPPAWGLSNEKKPAGSPLGNSDLFKGSRSIAPLTVFRAHMPKLGIVHTMYVGKSPAVLCLHSPASPTGELGH